MERPKAYWEAASHSQKIHVHPVENALPGGALCGMITWK